MQNISIDHQRILFNDRKRNLHFCKTTTFVTFRNFADRMARTLYSFKNPLKLKSKTQDDEAQIGDGFVFFLVKFIC
jgi:hypothetical protein